ncbi:WXG100 family type VII secretion target [Micromonospora sp. NPDC047670]|uniref:WXG100 family type VII secretion target n=1 Tax=Micromonospora sp. NPDC047670 TaxID=3364252 RepID=UPI0037136221
MIEPTDFLREPAQPDPSISRGFANPIGILDAISISHWVNQVIKDVAGYDVIGTITAAFVGDWESFYKAGDAYGNLGQSLQALGGNLIEVSTQIDQQWDGRAADAAFVYFRKLAAATAQQNVVLAQVQDKYHEAARAIWLLADMVGGLIKMIIDKAIIIGVSAAAGTALIETGVGAVAGYGIATWQAIELVKKVNDAALKIQTGGTLILGFFSFLKTLAEQGGDLSKMPLPDQPYTSPVPA